MPSFTLSCLNDCFLSSHHKSPRLALKSVIELRWHPQYLFSRSHNLFLVMTLFALKRLGSGSYRQLAPTQSLQPSLKCILWVRECMEKYRVWTNAAWYSSPVILMVTNWSSLGHVHLHVQNLFTDLNLHARVFHKHLFYPETAAEVYW